MSCGICEFIIVREWQNMAKS